MAYFLKVKWNPFIQFLRQGALFLFSDRVLQLQFSAFVVSFCNVFRNTFQDWKYFGQLTVSFCFWMRCTLHLFEKIPFWVWKSSLDKRFFSFFSFFLSCSSPAFDRSYGRCQRSSSRASTESHIEADGWGSTAHGMVSLYIDSKVGLY